jgi:hypothetical protein
MKKEFKVRWERTCYKCGCPMNIYISFEYDPEFIKYIINYYNIVPFDFSNNLPIYKCFGMKARKICLGCYENPNENLLSHLHRRELGMRNSLRRQEISKTQKEIYDWFEGFNRFLYKENAETLYFPQTLNTHIIWGLMFQINY